ncbi:ABC transporter substrate-binding protein [Streptomyces sp. 184]|uniref:ABC transporter substrate-binding protein n=1 Tax=Streptomyces sp. 184 TaxID=1827526 RepID=UPI0038923901
MRSALRTVQHVKVVRATVAIIAAGALAVTAAGCGDDGDDDNGGGGKTDKSGSGVTLPKLDGESLRVGAVWTGPEQENFEKVLDGFEEKTGATVEYVPTGDNVASFVRTQVAGGKPPDVVFAPQVGVLQEFVKEGWAKPLDAAAQKELSKNFSQGWQDLGAVDGKQYGVYCKAANKSLVWYNTTAFENAGAQEPEDWQGFMDTAQLVSDSGVPPVAVAGADGWTLTDWFENIYLSQAGPEKYDQLAAHEIPWTDPSVKDALTTLGELFGDETLVAGGTKKATKMAFPDSATAPFADLDNPKAAMVFEGDFVGAFVNETDAKVGENAKVFPFPAVGPEKPVVTGGDAAVSLTGSKGAQALLTYLSSTEAAQAWAEAGGFISPNKNMDMAAYPNDVQREIAQALVDAGDDFRFDMSDQAPADFGGTAGKGEWKALQDFLANPKDVEGAQQDLEKAAAAAYKS